MKILDRDAGFRAQKWCSNRTDVEVLEEIPLEDQATGVKLDDSELPSVKTLGVHWNASEDVFTFIVKEINLSFYTKRGLLSRIATLFDPLQFLAPYIIGAKMALQEASWLRGLRWDEEFPDDLKLISHRGPNSCLKLHRSKSHVAIDTKRKQWKTSHFIHSLMRHD